MTKDDLAVVEKLETLQTQQLNMKPLQATLKNAPPSVGFGADQG